MLWRSHSLWSSVASFSLLLVPLSRKLARGGRTFTPFTVTEPSMALRSWIEKKREEGVKNVVTPDNTHKIRRKISTDPDQTSHATNCTCILYIRSIKLLLMSVSRTGYPVLGPVTLVPKRCFVHSPLLCCPAYSFGIGAPVEIKLLTSTLHWPCLV